MEALISGQMQTSAHLTLPSAATPYTSSGTSTKLEWTHFLTWDGPEAVSCRLYQSVESQGRLDKQTLKHDLA